MRRPDCALAGWLLAGVCLAASRPGVAAETRPIAPDAACSPESQACFRAQVVAVSDGDTLRVRGATGRDITIRLAEIDAPEREQPWSEQATDALAELVLSRTVVVWIFDVDIHRRVVGRVFVEDLYVNAEMVTRGHAWAYTRYLQDRRLAELESEARRGRIGLWASVEPVAPWEWRKRPRR